MFTRHPTLGHTSPMKLAPMFLAFDFYKQYVGENIGPGWTLELQFDEETHYRSLEYLRRKHDQPFALVASYTSPHPRSVEPKKYWDMYENAEISIPEYYAEGVLRACIMIRNGRFKYFISTKPVAS